MKHIITKGYLAVGLTFASFSVFADSIKRDLVEFIPVQLYFADKQSEGGTLSHIGNLVYNQRILVEGKERVPLLLKERLSIPVYLDNEGICLKKKLKKATVQDKVMLLLMRFEPCSEEELMFISEQVTNENAKLHSLGGLLGLSHNFSDREPRPSIMDPEDSYSYE